MISLEGLSYTYPSCASSALKNINLEVKDGEFVLLTGESGCGKSTLLNCLNGIIPHLCGGVLSGKVQVNGFDPRDLSISRIAREVGTVFQNPENQIFMPTVKEDIVFGCRNLGFSQGDVEKKLDISLKELGLEQLKERETDALSNGEKQRLAIAGMYAASPRLFLFDESATDLDAKGRIEFREILKNLKAKGHTVILAEHDYADYADLADKKVFLEGGMLFAGIKDEPIAPGPGLLRELPLSEPVIKFKDVYCGYNNATDVLQDINVEIKKGECVVFVGNNGSGKTTFFKLIARALRPRKGGVFVNGSSKSRLDDIRGKVGFLFQNPDEQLFTNSVIDEVSFGPRQLKIAVDCNEMLRLFGLEKHRLQQPHQLSRGERQRLAFICVLAMQPEIIILDEPTTGLDRKSWIRLMDTAMQANRNGKTIIFSTHNTQIVQRYAQRVIRLEKGKISSDEIRK